MQALGENRGLVAGEVVMDNNNKKTSTCCKVSSTCCTVVSNLTIKTEYRAVIALKDTVDSFNKNKSSNGETAAHMVRTIVWGTASCAKWAMIAIAVGALVSYTGDDCSGLTGTAASFC